MKAWKWTRRLGSIGDMVEGEVHQHRLAAPDAAPQIDAARAALPLVEQLAEEAAAARSASSPASRSSAATARSCAGSGFSSPGSDQRGIGPSDRSAHAGAFRALMRFSVPVKL